MCARMYSIWLSIEMKRAKEFDPISVVLAHTEDIAIETLN